MLWLPCLLVILTVLNFFLHDILCLSSLLFHIIPAAIFLFNPMLIGSGDRKLRVKAQSIHFALWKYQRWIFWRLSLKQKEKEEWSTTQASMSYSWDLELQDFDGVLVSAHFLPDVLQNGIGWPRSFSTSVPWLRVAYRIPVIFLALLSWLYLLQMGKKRVLLQFGDPVFAKFLMYHTSLCLQYLTFLVHYLSKHSLATHTRLCQVQSLRDAQANTVTALKNDCN